MASPPTPPSPTAMSPPHPSPAQIPNKKRSSTLDQNAPPGKRRKASASAAIHPLRQTSFPPEARGSPYARSPSVDATSHVSGSAVSGVTATGAPKKKRGRKAKNAKNEENADKTPSLVGGRAPTNVSGQGGDKEGDEDEDDEKAEMALEDVVARTQEQKQEEIRLRAMLVEAFDSQQYNRYELWRAAKLADSVVKRVVNATVSQSVPQNVSTAVKAVAKLFAGEIIEAARNVQGEWVLAGEKQSELPAPPLRINGTGTHGNGNGTSDAKAGGDVDIVKSEEESKDHVMVLDQDHDHDEPRRDANSDPEPDLKRGPLRPDHLREAWRRYRISGESHGVGVQQLWHAQQCNGVERFSTRTGKRLFK